MTDLYELLGVERDASKATIRKAYRKKAKETHPDMDGGSAEAFAAVTKAGDTLTDDEKRARYDETGESCDTSPLDKAVEAFIDSLVDGLLNDTKSHTYDFLTRMRDAVSTDIGRLEKNIIEMELEEKRAAKLLERLIKKPSNDILSRGIKGRLPRLKGLIIEARQSIQMMTKALEVLSEYEFDPEKVETPPNNLNQVFMRLGAST